jgi:hypothetical protein
VPPLSSIVQVVDAVLHLPLSVLTEQTVPGSPFTGDGRLTRSAPGIGVDAWGLTWSFLNIPPQLGVVDGAVPIWNDRLLQLVAFYTSRSSQLPGEILDVNYDAGVWQWRTPFPFAIGYHTLPGVTVRFSWLIFTLS